MLDSRLQNLLKDASANAPWLVSLALSALIAIELARIAISSFGASPLKTPQPVGPGRPVAVARPVVDVQKVVAAHLFGVANAESTAADPSSAPPSSANLVLAGTIATQDPKHGVAIISDGGGPSKVYSVGETVGGATVHSVYLDRVLLDRGGSLEALTMPRNDGSSPPAAAAPRPAAMFGGNPRTAAAVENIRRMVQADPSILNEVMRTVPSYDNKAGRLRGFRAYPGRNRTAFSKLGLKPGDLVTAINGTPLDDPQRSQEVFNTIQTSERATVTVERAGQRQDITLNVSQVAQQASRDLDVDGSASGGPNPPSAPAPAPNEDVSDR
jgi:general secretion pathway protein C